MARLDALSPLQETSGSPIFSASSKKSSSDEFFNIYNSLKKEDPPSRDELPQERQLIRGENSLSAARRVRVSKESSIQEKPVEVDDLANSQGIDTSDEAQTTALESTTENSAAAKASFVLEQSTKGEGERAVCAKNPVDPEKENLVQKISMSVDAGQILPELFNILGLAGKATTENTQTGNTQEQEGWKEVWSSLLSGILNIGGDSAFSMISAENAATEGQGESASVPLLELLGGEETFGTQLDKLAGLLHQRTEHLPQMLEKENLPAGIPLQFSAEIRAAILKMLKDPNTSAQIQEKISQPGFQQDLLEFFDWLASQNNPSKEAETSASQQKIESLAGMPVAQDLENDHDLSSRALFADQSRKATNDLSELNPNALRVKNQSNGTDIKLGQPFWNIDQAKNFSPSVTSSFAKGNTNPEARMSEQTAMFATVPADLPVSAESLTITESKIASSSWENRIKKENPATSQGNKTISPELKNSQVDSENKYELLSKTGQPIQLEHGTSSKYAEGFSLLSEVTEKTLRSTEPLPVSHFSRLDPTPLQNATSLGSGKAAESDEMMSRIEKADLFAQIIDKARLISVKNQSEMMISLKPEFLGKMSLRASLVDNELVATINAESKQVRTLLENELPALRNSLQEQGIQVSKIVVVQESSLSFADWSQGNSTAHQHTKTNSNGFSPYRESSPAVDPDSSGSEPMSATMPYSSGMVNLVA